MTRGIAKSEPYVELLRSFPPRPISDEVEFAATQSVVDALLDRGASRNENRPEITADEQDYLNVLGTLIAEYEQTLVQLG
jgi:HTH-type transcriptional regulator/antitoxin HigA